MTHGISRRIWAMTLQISWVKASYLKKCFWAACRQPTSSSRIGIMASFKVFDLIQLPSVMFINYPLEFKQKFSICFQNTMKGNFHVAPISHLVLPDNSPSFAVYDICSTSFWRNKDYSCPTYLRYFKQIVRYVWQWN